MDYKNKYLKYKTKYLNLQYDENLNLQYGGKVPCNKGYQNMIGSCWAIALQMIFSFGDINNDHLEKVMKSFDNGSYLIFWRDSSKDTFLTNRDNFIETQIKKVQEDPELKDFFPEDFFKTPAKGYLIKILQKFIDRYYSKVFGIQNTEKPKDLSDPKSNKERCEIVIATYCKKLFQNYKGVKLIDDYYLNYYISKPNSIDDINHVSTFVQGNPLTEYLFFNLLSIFFLGEKYSFKPFYNNFNLINFDDKKDIGILIQTYDHVCCLFMCNGSEKYYNDNDKKIYNCNWKTLLNKSNINKLYVKLGDCLLFIDDINSYRGNKDELTKVKELVLISKYENDNTYDIELKNMLNLTNLDTITDNELLNFLIKDYYKYKKKNNSEIVKMIKYCLDKGTDIKDYNLLLFKIGNSYKENKEYAKAAEIFQIGVDYGDSECQLQLGVLYEAGAGVPYNIEEAERLIKLARDQGNKEATEVLHDIRINKKIHQINQTKDIPDIVYNDESIILHRINLKRDMLCKVDNKIIWTDILYNNIFKYINYGNYYRLIFTDFTDFPAEKYDYIFRRDGYYLGVDNDVDLNDFLNKNINLNMKTPVFDPNTPYSFNLLITILDKEYSLFDIYCNCNILKYINTNIVNWLKNVSSTYKYTNDETYTTFFCTLIKSNYSYIKLNMLIKDEYIFWVIEQLTKNLDLLKSLGLYGLQFILPCGNTKLDKLKNLFPNRESNDQIKTYKINDKEYDTEILLSPNVTFYIDPTLQNKQDGLKKLIDTIVSLVPDNLDLTIGHPRLCIRISQNLFILVHNQDYNNSKSLDRYRYNKENMPLDYKQIIDTCANYTERECNVYNYYSFILSGHILLKWEKSSSILESLTKFRTGVCVPNNIISYYNLLIANNDYSKSFDSFKDLFTKLNLLSYYDKLTKT
jgi:hypothetical protein